MSDRVLRSAAALLLVLAAAFPARAGEAELDSSRSEDALFESLDQGMRLARDRRSWSSRRLSSSFYPPGEFPGESAPIKAALAAVVELDAGHSRCAGVYISRSGHILTAAHCFRDHLSKASRSTAADLSVLEHKDGAVRYGTIVPEVELEGAPVVLVAAGRGFLSHLYSPPDVGRLSGDADTIARLGKAASGDWAIVKAQRSSPGPCVAARKEPLSDDEPLWAAGFPGPATRPDGPGSSGSDGLRVTHGRRCLDLSASEWQETVGPLSREVFRAVYQPGISNGDIILSSVDSFKGMSGGPFIDRHGELAGVLSASGHTKSRFFDNSTIGVGVQHIIRELGRHAMDPAALFDCR